MNKDNILQDDTLSKVVGGSAIDDPQNNGRCKCCAGILKKTSYGFLCSDCGIMYDKKLNPIEGEDTKAQPLPTTKTAPPRKKGMIPP